MYGYCIGCGNLTEIGGYTKWCGHCIDSWFAARTNHTNYSENISDWH